MRVPPAGDSPTSTRPPCWATTCRTIARPSPEPGIERDSSDRQKRSKTCGLSAASIPGPSSSTVRTPAASRTVMVPPGGLHFAALSSRLVMARSSPVASPCAVHDSRRTSNSSPGARRRTLVAARSATSPRSSEAMAVSVSSSRARTTRSPTRTVSSPICARTSSSSSRRAASGSPPAPVGSAPVGSAPVGSAPSACASRSRLVRSEVSGVRSSWLASATRRRWRSRDAARAPSIWLNAAASRAISSSPSTCSGVRSSVTAIVSTERVSRRTGRSPLVATAQPASAAANTPSPPETSMTVPSLRRVRSCDSNDWASTSACPLPAGTVATR